MNGLNCKRLYLCFAVILSTFVAISVLECITLSYASTSTGTSKAPQRKGFFRRSRSSKKNPGHKDASDINGSDDTVEETKTKQKTSWQFFYQKKEDSSEEESENKENDAESKEVGENDDGLRDQKSEEEEIDVKDEEVEKSEENEDQDDKATSSSNSNNDSNEEDDSKDSKSIENDENDGEDKKQDTEQSEKSEENKTNSAQQKSQDPMQIYRNQLLQQQQRFLSPGAIIYRSPHSMNPHSMNGNPMHQQQHPGMPSQGQAMVAAAVINLVSLASKVLFLKWIINKLAFDSESKSPVQHFMWECLNDKYVKDDAIWKRVLNRVPHSMGISQRKWDKKVKAMLPNAPKKNGRNQIEKKGSDKKKTDSKRGNTTLSGDDEKVDQQSTETNLETPLESTKTVVVMDFSTMSSANPDFLRFADVVTFLVSSNNPQKQMFGQKPEIILTLLSPGGEVTSFGFAAAQVARLRDAGWNVTVCVDRIAASGGYMIASQATQILASPFAMVGSVGVITEALNFYEILKKHGIQSLVLKAGDSKNPITQFGQVTDENIKTTQRDLDETHESFIDLCRSRRPTLDPAVCNGRILSGDKALDRGMIDRIITSDEYILEKISEGDLVMKLHLVSGNTERNMMVAALQILPHLKSKFKNYLFAGGQNSLVGRLNAVMDGNLPSKILQILGLTSMIRRALMRQGKSFGANNT